MQHGIEALQRRGRNAARLYLPDSAWSYRLRNWVMGAMPKSMLLNYFIKSAQEELHMTDHIQLRQADGRTPS